MPETTKGILYIVATPIGNLADISLHAVEILKGVERIAAEDTRHSRHLLERLGIARPLTALHEHNEQAVSARLIERLMQGESVALISDAGTPLINDPGFPLVRLAREQGIRVVPIPGPCALIAALCASGLPTDRFCFEGFPPRRSAARREWLETLLDETRTLGIYESSHRVFALITDIAEIFPSRRRIVIARELTKIYETIVSTTAAEAPAWFERDSNMHKGEFVILIEGAPIMKCQDELTHEQLRVLRLLLAECSVKTAAQLCARITGCRKAIAYHAALRLQDGDKVTAG